jgi:copper oxidase (laccase) domain-containing protein
MVGHGADPGRMTALIGPNACGLCYEVPADMRADVAAVVPETWAVTRQGTAALDIRAGIVAQLAAAGVAGVEHDRRCTIESPELRSYRRDRSRTGFAGYIWLS